MEIFKKYLAKRKNIWYNKSVWGTEASLEKFFDSERFLRYGKHSCF